MAINPHDYRVRPNKKVHLKKWPTRVKAPFKSKKQYRQQLEGHIRQMDTLQRLLYASNQYSLLLIFQAMDAAGKDGAIRHVMSGVNPQGCQVFSFQHPSAEELDHDFLWRTTCRLPERGRIGIFNRSYYEEVLIVRVHPEILAAQRLPEEAVNDKGLWENRFKSIVDLESHLHRNGTRVIKFFLHLSKDEQRERFIKRIDDPEKNWKFSAGDIAERALWDDYMHAYEKALAATSTAEAPWYVVPADDKETARLIISQTIVDTMKGMKMEYPKLPKAKVAELKAIRAELMKGK